MTVVRRYQPAPAPPPPDEAYWEALLAAYEEEAQAPSDEAIDWAEIAEVSLSNSRDYHQSYNNLAQWSAAEAAFQQDSTIHLPVIGFNRGGLLVEWDSLRGFVPASQLSSIVEGIDLQQALMRYIGHSLPLRVIELDRQQNRLILSERAAQVMPGTRANVLQNLRCHSEISGTVTNLCNFGAFVDLGGVEGLIHISELSWGRVEHPSEVLCSGQVVRVYIMSVDKAEGRIALSLKRLQPDPWLTVEERYHVGQTVEGVITSVVDFGAFTSLEEGLEGLIHISELAEGHFLHPRNVVQAGQQLRVHILNIDSHARRIGLSLRNVKQYD